MAMAMGVVWHWWSWWQVVISPESILFPSVPEQDT
jgi:hypothetical protein